MIHMGLSEIFAYLKIQLYVIMFLLKRPCNSGVYPLVNIYTTMENHHFWGKSMLNFAITCCKDEISCFYLLLTVGI